MSAVFYESFNQQSFEVAIGRSVNFVQDNHLLPGLRRIARPALSAAAAAASWCGWWPGSSMWRIPRPPSQWVGELLSAENKDKCRKLLCPFWYLQSAELHKTTD
jgi:dTDP-4-dehydrorhamnose 3,5-epimerase